MDCTHLIERLEAFEERMGVRLEALFAGRGSENSYLKLRGELHPTQGTILQQDVELVADVYNGLGQLIDHESRVFPSDKFYGFETFELWICGDIPDSAIAKIRLYPKRNG